VVESCLELDLIHRSAWKVRFWEQTRSPLTLSGCSQNGQPYCTFSGLGDCPNKLSFLSRALKRCVPVYTWAFLEWTTVAPVRLTAHLWLAADPYRISYTSGGLPSSRRKAGSGSFAFTLNSPFPRNGCIILHLRSWYIPQMSDFCCTLQLQVGC
jgi:hypothetical protein